MYTSAGMRMNPPPTPSIPDSRPVAKPITRITHSEIDSMPDAGSLTIGHNLMVRRRRTAGDDVASPPRSTFPAERLIVRIDSRIIAWPRKMSSAA